MKACTVTSLTEKQFLKTPPKAICEQIQKNKNRKIRKQTKMKSIEVQMTKRTLLAKKCVDNQRLSQRKTSLLNIRCGNMLVLWKSLTVFRYKGRILNVTAKQRELCFLICIYVANANICSHSCFRLCVYVMKSTWLRIFLHIYQNLIDNRALSPSVFVEMVPCTTSPQYKTNGHRIFTKAQDIQQDRAKCS